MQPTPGADARKHPIVGVVSAEHALLLFFLPGGSVVVPSSGGRGTQSRVGGAAVTGSSGAGTRVASRPTGPRKRALTGIQQRAERVVRACPRGRPPRERRLYEHDESPVDRVDGRCRQCPRKPTAAAPPACARVARPRREIVLSAATRANLATPGRARPRAPRACTGTASHRMLVHVADTAPRHRSSAPSGLPCGPLVRAEARACRAAASTRGRLCTCTGGASTALGATAVCKSMLKP